MTLLDREDAIRLELPMMALVPKMTPGTRADGPDVVAEGPFLLLVNDEYAHVGQFDPTQGEVTYREVANKRGDSIQYQQWRGLTDLYVEDLGWSRRTLTSRVSSVRKQLLKADGAWCLWDEVYHWPDGSDRVFEGLLRHPWIETREHENGVREARYRHGG